MIIIAIVSLGCLHPVTKVQSAALHFFLDEEVEEDSDEDEEDVRTCLGLYVAHILMSSKLPDIKALHHRRTINKKTRSGDKKLERTIKTVNKVCCSVFA